MILRSPKVEAGFSLIELMVSITIGLFLLAGAVAMFSSNRRISNDQQDLTDLQQHARFALDRMIYDIRMAGYVGCSNDRTRLTNNLRGGLAAATVGNLFDFNFPVEGREANGNWLPSNNAADTVVDDTPNAPTNVTAAEPFTDTFSDAVTIRSVGGPRVIITGTASGTAAQTVAFNNDVAQGGIGLVQGEVVAIHDCNGADLFNNTASTDLDATSTLAYAAGGTSDGENAVATLSRSYAGAGTSPASVSRVTAVRYFVGQYIPDDLQDANEPVRRGLFRRFWDPAAAAGTGAERSELLIDGVDRMEITYGVDNVGGDRLPDIYVSADNAALGTNANGWRNVVAVRIGLLLRSLRPNASEADSGDGAIIDPACAAEALAARDVNGTCVPYGDVAPAALGLASNVRRRVVTTTVFIRNNPL